MKVITPSRLHFGFIDLAGSLGRKYGSIGAALSFPGWEIRIEKSLEVSIEGAEPEAEKKILSVLDSFYNEYKVLPRVKVVVKASVPFHRGLGAGTQLSLAVTEGLMRVYSVRYNEMDIARVSMRGKRSGVGIMSYFKGGFNMDAGKKEGLDTLPLPLLHFDFPSEWVFLVVNSSINVSVHGVYEEKKLSLVNVHKLDEIPRIILMKLLPALKEGDIKEFGEALTVIQRIEGEAFLPAQGGIFASDMCEALISFMLESGAYGAGQSSWGPVVYALVDKDGVGSLRTQVNEYMCSAGISGEVWISSVSDRGRLLVGD